jgi:hypothetical protein
VAALALGAALAVQPAGATVFTVTTTADAGPGSLRQAILDANASLGLDTIAFAIPGAGVHTIVPTSALPPIIDPVVIDGYSQPGSSANTATVGNNAVILVELSGQNAGTANGLNVTGGGSTVQGLAINRWALNGVRIATAGGNVVTGNFIGTDPAGMGARGNGFSGVTVLYASSTNNQVQGNVISGNGTGISTAGPGDQETQILGNLIGTDALGTAAIPNGTGIVVNAGNNFVGDGLDPTHGNVISGNSENGVVVDSVSAAGCRIYGNRIGTDATGTLPLGNAHVGVVVSNTTDVFVGGSSPGQGNLISGNGDQGISISTSTSIDVEGNLIGTDVTGIAPLGNGISGAPFGGIYLSDSSGCTIGSATGANVIAFNDGNGVTVFTFGTASGDSVRYNRIYGNLPRLPSAGLAIDLGDDGPTANDACDSDIGANGLQNFPVVTSTVIGAGSVQVSGYLNSTANTTFDLDFYADPACSPRPQAYLQATSWIGSAQVTTDASCNVNFSVTLSATVDPASVVTATATAPDGSTSELSQRFPFTITPISGPAAGGTGVTIQGTDFQPGATVTIGGAPASGVTVNSATQISATTPALSAGTRNDVTVTNPDATSGTIPSGFVADFLDVPETHPFYPYVTTLVANGVTAGCGGGNYCVNASITRAQMAVFLLKGKLGVCDVPPPATGMVFADVPIGSFAADWIEDLHARGITGGCGGGDYCPSSPVTRAQMAVFLLKTLLGSGYVPPPASGTVFEDVPIGSFAADWIEDLHARGITAGCSASPSLYCPSSPNTRGQMAVFIVKTFQLP